MTEDNTIQNTTASQPPESQPGATAVADGQTETEHSIQLDVFHGPMDLLLYLVKKSEVDIWDVPIGDIADQYLDTVRMMESIDIEMAGEFLVMAASLMEIKSRMLLPRPELDDEGEPIDPRSELIQQLLEYKRFKEASMAMGSMEAEAAKRFHRLAADKIKEEINPDADDSIRDLTLWDLMAAFKKIMADLKFIERAGTIIKTDRPVQFFMDSILSRLQARPIASFSDFFQDSKDRGEVIGLFLAILELVKLRNIRAEQQDDYAEIRLILISNDPTPEPDFDSVTTDSNDETNPDVDPPADTPTEYPPQSDSYDFSYQPTDPLTPNTNPNPNINPNTPQNPTTDTQ